MCGESKNEGLLAGGEQSSGNEKCRPPPPGGHPEAETAAFLAAIVESSGDAIISKDLDGVVTSWNRGAEHIFGYRAAEVIGRHVSILIPPDRMGEEAHILDRIRSGERVEPYETVRCRKDGTMVDISLTVSPIRNPGGTIIGASKIARDISEQLRDREQLRQSEERFRVTLESIGDGVICTGREGRVTFMNSVAGKITGWRKEEVMGVPLDHVFRIINEYTRQPVENPVARVIEKGHTVGLANHTVLISKDGEELPIDDSAAPIRGQNGELTGVVLIFRDVTGRKQTVRALAKAHAEMKDHARNLETLVDERTAKLQQTIDDLEAFSFTVSHDLRSPLRSMQGFAYAVLTEYADKLDAQGREYLERISNSAVRLDKLILEVLKYSRIGRSDLAITPLDLDKLLEDVMHTYPAIRAANAKIVVEHPLHSVLGSHSTLVQCVSNLLSNAVKFVAPGTKANVLVWTAKQDGTVRLFVKDGGIGIPEDMLSKIFEPFQRAHPAGGYEGTGMGLAIVRKAMQRMGGSVGVKSLADQGSTFWLELPGAEHKPVDQI
jgi:PAS domain S-box-containing protein